MESRNLEITLLSAKDLNKVNRFTKMDVYAIVSINRDQTTRQKTPVDRDGGSDPEWNHSMKFTIDETAAQQNRLTLVILLRSDRQLGDKDIGEVQIPIKELLDHNDEDGKADQVVCYSVMMPNGRAKGNINFSYKFGEKTTVNAAPVPEAVHETKEKSSGSPAMPVHYEKTASSPVIAYPAPAVGYPRWPTSGGYPSPRGYPPSSYVYPPGRGGYQQPPPPGTGVYPPSPPPGPGVYAALLPPGPAGGYPQPAPAHGYGGYQPAPAPGYGYPGYSPQGNYGYMQQHHHQQQQHPKPKKHGLGKMGLGVGLAAGGLLGGMLLGDMVGDVASGIGDMVGGVGDAVSGVGDAVTGAVGDAVTGAVEDVAGSAVGDMVSGVASIASALEGFGF